MSNYFGTDGIRGKANEEYFVVIGWSILAHFIVDWLRGQPTSSIIFPDVIRVWQHHDRAYIGWSFAAVGANVRYWGLFPRRLFHTVVVNKADLGM